jgi:hypothetical protein
MLQDNFGEDGPRHQSPRGKLRKVTVSAFLQYPAEYLSAVPQATNRRVNFHGTPGIEDNLTMS